MASTTWYSDQNFLVVKIETDFPEYYGVGCTALKTGGHEHVSVFTSDVRPALIGCSISEAKSVASYVQRYDAVSRVVLGVVNLALWNLLSKLEKKNAFEALAYRQFM